jgi:hypothetical protein
VEIRRMEVQGQSREIVHEMYLENIQNTKKELV